MEDPLIPAPTNGYGTLGDRPVPITKVYKRRWYILLLYCLFACMQSIVWNTWAPIAGPAEWVFEWEDSTIALFGNYGCIVMVVSVMFFSWLITVKGFRVALLANAFLMAAAAAMRCIPMNKFDFTITCHVSSIVNGFAVLAQGGPAIVSTIWFPEHERITATAIGAAACQLGVGVSFVIGPRMVGDIHARNTSGDHSLSHLILSNSTPTMTPYGPTKHDIHRAHREIMNLMYLDCGLSVAIFLLILLYFPAKPHYPPSASAAEERVNYGDAVRLLVRNWRFWQIALPYALVLGVYGDWSSLVDVDLKPLGVSQSIAGWIGFFCIVAACVGAFLAARLNDIFPRRMKQSLLIMLVISGVAILYFALMVQNIVKPSIVMFYVTAIVASLCIGGSAPLYYELICETTYPCPESVAGGAQMVIVNLVGVLFYLVFLIPNIGTSWMNWVQFAVCVPAFILICTHTVHYGRLDIDDRNQAEIENSMEEPSDPIT